MDLKYRIRALCCHTSPQERQLWFALNHLMEYPQFDPVNQQLWFVRHAVVGDFIVDFLCPTLRLVITLDSGINRDATSLTQQKNLVLQYRGFLVVRVRQTEIEDNWQGLLKYLNLVFCQRWMTIERHKEVQS